jgi:predicted DNA-binding antitoxin AbrB/MazE fold protein
MSAQRIEAVYESGTFRPVAPLPTPLREGQHVQLTVEGPSDARAYLDLATHVLDGLSDEDIAAIEAIAQRRPRFFGSRDLPPADAS